MDSEANPYAPPASRLEAPEAPPASADLASSGQRLSNLLLDTLGTYLFSFLIGIGVALADETRLELLDDFGFGLALSLVYFGGSEALTGRTPAKLLTGTRVVSARGGRATSGQILGRTLSRLVPFDAFSFLGERNPVGWHDRWSNTRVVRARSPR